MIQMSNRLGMVALLVALVAPMAPVAAAEAKTPPLLVRLASIETLTRQFFLLAEKVNRKAEAEQLKNALQSVTGPGGIQGFLYFVMGSFRLKDRAFTRPAARTGVRTWT